ncbi:MAG: cyclic nucleotide-binding domain-containing protein, partial [Nitrospiraceae bacterium]
HSRVIMHLDIITIIGILAGAFYVASQFQKDMISLRVLALVSNILYLLYSPLHTDYQITQLIVMPTFLVNLILLPINAKRLIEIIRLIKQIEQATVESPVTEWLLPHMHLRKHKAGEVLFRKGDKADEMMYVAIGKLKLQDIDHFIGPGELIGEIGLFSSEKVRTLTVVCDTDCELYHMTDQQIYRLYYQNPKLGFFFMKLIVERLLRDVKRRAIEQGTG